MFVLFQVILDSGHRVRAETYGDQTSLTIEVTEREDTGNYKMVLQNEAGEATASVKIKVVGKKKKRKKIQNSPQQTLKLNKMCCLQTFLILRMHPWYQRWEVIGVP